MPRIFGEVNLWSAAVTEGQAALYSCSLEKWKGADWSPWDQSCQARGRICPHAKWTEGVLVVLSIVHPMICPIISHRRQWVPSCVLLRTCPTCGPAYLHIVKTSSQPGLHSYVFLHTSPLRLCLTFMYMLCHPVSKLTAERKQQRKGCKETSIERKNDHGATGS